jgi:hypothetical protein
MTEQINKNKSWDRIEHYCRISIQKIIEKDHIFQKIEYFKIDILTYHFEPTRYLLSI